MVISPNPTEKHCSPTHGDKGSLFLSNWHDFNGTVEYADFGGTYQPLPYVKEPYAGNTAEDPHAGVEWSRGVLDMAKAMQENRPQRITGAQAAHVIDIVCGDHFGVSTARAHGDANS